MDLRDGAATQSFRVLAEDAANAGAESVFQAFIAQPK